MRTWMLLTAVACSGNTDGTDADGKDGTPATGETGTLDTDTGTTMTGDISASITGTLTDGSGAPVNGAVIRFCRGFQCRNGNTDSSGIFGFDDVLVDWHSLEIKAAKGVDGMATLLVPVVFATDESRTIDLVQVPLDPATPLQTTPTEIETGEGLFLTLQGCANAATEDCDDATLEPPLFFDPATEVAGVKLEPNEWVPTDQITGTVLAQWLLEPFDYHAAGGVPVRIANDFGLADGTDVRVYVGSYEDSLWLDAGTLTAAGTSLDGSASLPLLSTIVLVQE